MPYKASKFFKIWILQFFKNWMFNFVSLLKYKRQMMGNKLCVNLRFKFVTRHLTFILQQTDKIKHSILIIIELYKLVHFLYARL